MSTRQQRCKLRHGAVVASLLLGGSILNIHQSVYGEQVGKMDLRKPIPITGIERVDGTITPPTGVGDLWSSTWGKDDKLYVGLCDGWGWKYLPDWEAGLKYNTRIFAIEGMPPNYRAGYLPDYPLLEGLGGLQEGRYYGMGILAVDNRIYHFLSTLREPLGAKNNGFAGVKLIYTEDGDASWRNQDGSTPVVWEEWEKRGKENMLFWKEPDEAFSMLSVLQMGKNYEWNQDGYGYIYAPNGNVDGKINQLVLCRVKKEQIPNRDAYEYFVARQPDGSAKWSKDIAQKAPVYTFPKGYANWKGGHAWAWLPSVVYNKPLGQYLMVTWGMGVRPDGGNWFEKPSYLGFWAAPNPWGPWTQVHEEKQWLPLGKKTDRAYAPQMPSKWFSEDGKSFWLVWTDFQKTGKMRKTPRGEYLGRDEWSASHRFYAFQCQKVLIETKE